MSARARAQRPRRAPRRERGIALLVAVLLVALGTIIAAAVAYDNAMTVRRGEGTFAFDEALLVGQGAEALAAWGLRTLAQNNPQKQIYLNQGWDKPQGPMEVVPGVMLTASLEDMQGRFNLNNLVDEHGMPDAVMTAAFTQLLASLGLEEKWTGYLVDWIDHDIMPSSPDGGEDTVYMGQTPPYRTANRYITSTTELLALPGFGRERYLKLAPYVAALPHNTKLNLCTAAGIVLDAFIGAGHSEFSDPDTLAKNRQAAGGCFPTKQDYSRAFTDPKLWSGAPAPGVQPGLVLAGNQPAAGAQQGGVGAHVDVTSSYFRLTSFITIGSTEFNLYSLLYQDGTTGFGVRPIQRSFTPD